MADDKSERPIEDQVALAGVVGAALGVLGLLGNKLIKGEKKKPS